jgi:hypothetical protein
VVDIAVFPFTPYPGSELHKELREQNLFPEEGETYDLLMAANLNNNYRMPKSWNEYVSDRQLRLLLIGGTLLFYGTQYLLRPWRLLASGARIIGNNPLTLTERVLYNLVRRFRRMGRGVAPEATSPQAIS